MVSGEWQKRLTIDILIGFLLIPLQIHFFEMTIGSFKLAFLIRIRLFFAVVVKQVSEQKKEKLFKVIFKSHFNIKSQIPKNCLS
jgi:hypothetical protein